MKKLRWILEYILYKVFTFPILILPRKLRLLTGSFTGLLIYYLLPRYRKVTYTNLALAFPDKERSWYRKTALASYKNLGRTATEAICFRKLNKKNLNRYLDSVEGRKYLDEAYEKNEGVFCLASHFGNWEFLALASSLLGYKVSVVARLTDNPYLERELSSVRLTTGGRIIHKKNAIRNMRKALKDGHLIGILVDQNQIQKEGVFVDFFGTPASTTPSVALLSLKYDTPIIPCYSLPLENNKYKLVFDKPLKIKRSGDSNKDLINLVQLYTSYIENIVREYPQYWLWMHKRWKTRPEGEENNFYK